MTRGPDGAGPAVAGARRLVRAGLAAAVALPVALVADVVRRDGFAVPYWDGWELVPLLVRAHDGRLTLADLWAQHNEHRLVVPRLVFLGLARLSAWDVRWELWASLAVAVLALGVLGALVGRTVPDASPEARGALLVPVAWLLFSMTQSENWRWGWQLQVWLNVLAAIVAAWALARWPDRWPGPVVASAAGIVAALSFANGLALLGLVPLAILAGPGGRRPGRALVAGLAGGPVAWAYLATFRHPAGHPDHVAVLRHPGDYLTYVATYVGAPLGAGRWEVAAPSAVAGVAALAGAALVLWRATPAGRGRIVPWALLGVYVIASGAMTGVGRLGFGRDQALAPRYASIAALFWVAVLVLGALAARALAPAAGPALRRRPLLVGLLAAAVTLAGLAGSRGYAAAYRVGLADLRAASRKVRLGEACLAAYRRAPDDCLALLYPAPATVRERAGALEALGLGPFAPGRRPPTLEGFVPLPPEVVGGAIDGVRGEDGSAGPLPRRTSVVVEGWAIDPLTGRAPAGILVVVGGEPLGVAPVGSRRESGPRGWRFRFGGRRLPPGSHLVEAFAILEDGVRVARLDGARTIDLVADGP